MIQMLFSLRFQGQLRRTRPSLIADLENSLIRTLEDSGGKVRQERRIIEASFDETAVGFWLDMFVTLEGLLGLLKKAAAELYGYTCVIGENIDEEEGRHLIRRLPAVSKGTGIWCSPLVRRNLEAYAVFIPSLLQEEPDGGAGKNARDYIPIRALRAFPEVSTRFAGTDKIENILYQGAYQNILLSGPEFMGKRNGLYNYCFHISRNIPPLVIRFGSGGTGLCCIVDALNTGIRLFLSRFGESENFALLDSLAAAISRERLKDEFSLPMTQKAGRFFGLLLETYLSATEKEAVNAFLILENVQIAGETALSVIRQVYAAFPKRKKIQVFGTASPVSDAAWSPEETAALWKPVFEMVIKLSADYVPPPFLAALTPDLWEIAYGCELLRRYFPGGLIPELFAEEGKNPAMISRALGMLLQFGLIDTADDPRPSLPGFAGQAEQILGDRKEKIASMVRSRLLASVARGRIRPCFNLIYILAELGGAAGDELILDALCADIINGTYGSIRKAIEARQFASLAGEERVNALGHIFRTREALVHGSEEQIREVFQEPVPEEPLCPAFKVQILSAQGSYRLGIGEPDGAEDAVKESILISQKHRGGRGLAQAYRLFSLVNLYRQRLGETIDYCSFAIEHAEKLEDYTELAITAYYAAGTQALFGNLAQAERLARQAETAALNSEQNEWADRSVFLQGKLRFETGRYRDAHDIFTSLRVNPSAPVSSAADTLLSAWIYRSAIFLGQPDPPPPPPSTDALLFEIEASYLTGDYEKTEELTSRLLAILPEWEFLFIEQPDWRSGFAQGELLLFPRRDFFGKLASVYRALALCRLDRHTGTDQESAVHIMQRLMRDERLPDTDPNDAFYYYAQYRVLQESGSAEVDMNTAVSMAFKRLQRRASRIDDPEIKRSFLNLHYWNNALCLTAKEHKLI